jgi:hypothetical protein
VLIFGVLVASFLGLGVQADARRPVTPLSHPRVVLGSSESTNWSGYAVTGPAGSVTSAAGSWKVPTVTCSSTSTSYVAFWVGIDGYSSGTVEQTGTMAECSRGSPSYFAWYEFYPNPSFEITTIAVSPGDTVSASVAYLGSSQFKTTIEDTTTGASYSTSAIVSSAQESSAEWITEAPSSSQGGILPLANFGTVSCGGDYTHVSSTDFATVSGVTGPVNSFGSSVQEITMVSNSGATEAQPSTISADGTSFSIAYVGQSSTSTATTATTTSTTSSTTSSTTTTTSSSTTTSTSSSGSLLVTASTNKNSYTQGNYVEVTVRVTTSSGAPVSRAAVTITVTNPNGGTSSETASTRSNGDVTFKYSLSRNAPLGVYTVSVVARAGNSAGSGSATFGVT